jgi:hypothetical protein
MNAASLALCAALSLLACNQRDAAAPTVAPPIPTPVASGELSRPDLMVGANLVPRTYEVPPGRAAELRRIFKSGAVSYPIAVVSAQGTQTQFVQPRPEFTTDGRMIISVPLQYHAAIEQMLHAMKSGAPPKNAGKLEIAYWVVEAVVAPDVAVSPDLAEIAPTLRGLANLGKRNFKSIDRVSARVAEGVEAKIEGRLVHIDHSLATQADALQLDVTLFIPGLYSDGKNSAGPRIQTSVQIEADKPIVLGDTAQSASSDGASNLLLYVVRARRVD